MKEYSQCTQLPKALSQDLESLDYCTEQETPKDDWEECPVTGNAYNHESRKPTRITASTQLLLKGTYSDKTEA